MRRPNIDCAVLVLQTIILLLASLDDWCVLGLHKGQLSKSGLECSLKLLLRGGKVDLNLELGNDNGGISGPEINETC
jgi:hypothetical protein